MLTQILVSRFCIQTLSIKEEHLKVKQMPLKAPHEIITSKYWMIDRVK